MQVSCTPDYGAGENGWRRLLIEQANDLVLDGEAELFPWLVGQAWEVKRAGLLAGPLPVLPGAGEPEAKFQDLAQDGGGDGDHGLGPDHVLGSDLGLDRELDLGSDLELDTSFCEFFLFFFCYFYPRRGKLNVLGSRPE